MHNIEAAATANFVAHATFPSEGLGAARVHRSPELTWVDSGLGTDTFNIVAAARLAEELVAGALREVREHFAAVRGPFSWWVAPGDRPLDLAERLQSGGLVAEERELAMACSLDRLATAPAVPGLRIARVHTPEELERFARINAENWSPPDEAVERFYRRAADRLLWPESPQRFFLAASEGQPVAAVEITIAAGVAGVYGLSTRAAFRNRGIGGALLESSLHEAGKESGVTAAVLQAAPAAAGLYRRLGFEEFGRIREFKARV